MPPFSSLAVQHQCSPRTCRVPLYITLLSSFLSPILPPPLYPPRVSKGFRRAHRKSNVYVPVVNFATSLPSHARRFAYPARHPLLERVLAQRALQIQMSNSSFTPSLFRSYLHIILKYLELPRDVVAFEATLQLDRLGGTWQNLGGEA